MKNIIFILIFVVLSMNIFAQNPITPNGKEVNATTYPDLSQDDIIYINNEIATNFSFVETIQSPEPYFGTFNCHFFAWHNNQGYTIWSGSGNIWQNGTPPQYKWFDYPTDYFSDGSYSNPSGYISHVQTTDSYAPIAVYRSSGTIKHSARRLSGSTELISKWGAWGVYQHGTTEVPSTYGSITEKYKINPNYRPVGSGDPGGRDWGTISNALNGITSGSVITVFSGTQALSGNISIPSGVKLKLNASTTINFNGYYIISTGGTIEVESGVTENFAYLKNGTTIKGLFPTVNSALSQASTGDVVEVKGTSSLSANISLGTSKTILLKTGSTLNMNGYYIKLTGGTIIQESGSTLQGLSAYVKYYSTIKGYYPSIQSALSNVSAYQKVELLGITYNQNVSMTNKYLVTLTGVSNTKINGNVTVTDCYYSKVINLEMDDWHTITVNDGYATSVSNIDYDYGSSLIYVYNGDIISLSGINAAFESPEFAVNLYNSSGNIYGVDITGFDLAIYSANYSDYNVTESYFCNNLLDLHTSSGGYIFTQHCTFSGTIPSTIYGNVDISGTNYVCALNKSAVLADNETADKIEIPEELKKLNAQYLKILGKLSVDNKNGKELDLEQHKDEFLSLIRDYKNLINNDIDNNVMKAILAKLEACYNSINKKEEFSLFISGLLNASKAAAVPYLKRHLIKLHLENGNYDLALQKSKEIQITKDVGEDLICEMLYEQGLIHKYYKGNVDEAMSIFSELAANYPENDLARFAIKELNEEELSIPDQNVSKNNEKVEASRLSINNYPNPFNPTTTISFNLREKSRVILKVFD
ncbi:MAG: hypothetical protein KKG93_11605, partial [Bacteroidetes bacterium]|nr:hypothetical protein [Bacteroidota bacterium]